MGGEERGGIEIRLQRSRNPLDVTTGCGLEDGICAFHKVEPGKSILDIRRSAPAYIKSVRSGSRIFSPRAIEVLEGGD